jgi:hypothetical protein
MGFAKFMAGPIGRGVRVLAGALLVALGLFGMEQPVGIIVAAVGVVFILVGVLNICLIAPIIGAPFRGKEALTR